MAVENLDDSGQNAHEMAIHVLATRLRASLELASATGYATLRERALVALNSGHRELAENPLWNATPLRAVLSYLEMRSFATGQLVDGGRSAAGLMIH